MNEKRTKNNQWIKELGLTEKDIDEMWEGLAIMNHPTIKNLYGKKIDWRGLNPMVAEDIPRIYDEYLKKFLNGEGTI